MRHRDERGLSGIMESYVSLAIRVFSMRLLCFHDNGLSRIRITGKIKTRRFMIQQNAHWYGRQQAAPDEYGSCSGAALAPQNPGRPARCPYQFKMSGWWRRHIRAIFFMGSMRERRVAVHQASRNLPAQVADW